jgi:hypothetical protein
MPTIKEQGWWGWYYEGGSVQAESNDMWESLFSGVETANEDERLHALRVGPMRDLDMSELLDADDVISMAQDGWLTPDAVVELVSERTGDCIEEGRAYIDGPEAKAAFRRIVQAHTNEVDGAPDIVAWAREHITLAPSTFCAGRFPLPIEYVEGEWRYGCTDPEPPDAAACITFTTNPSPENGHVGWCWWALGKMGEARTLREARAAAEAVIEKMLASAP